MAAGITGTSQLDNILPTFIAAAKFTLQEREVMANLFERVRLPRGQGTAYNEPKFATVTAYDLTQGIDMAQAQQITDTNLAITPGEIGCQVIITRRVVEQAKENVMTAAGKVAGNAMALKRNRDLHTLLDGFSTSQPGANNVLGIGHLMAAKSNIIGNTTEPPPSGKLVAVLHPFQLHASLEDVLALASGSFGTASPNTGDVASEIVRNHELARIAGLTIIYDNSLVIDSSADAKGGAFHREAARVVDFRDEEVEKEYDSSLRAWEMNLTQIYGYGEYQDAWGYEFYADATAPTS